MRWNGLNSALEICALLSSSNEHSRSFQHASRSLQPPKSETLLQGRCNHERVKRGHCKDNIFVACKTSFALYTSTHSNHRFSVEMGLAKSLWAASNQFVKSVSVCTIRDDLETVHNRLLLLLSTSIAVVQRAAQAHNVWRPRQRCYHRRHYR